MTGHLADRFNFESGTNCSTQTTPNRDCDIQSRLCQRVQAGRIYNFILWGGGGGVKREGSRERVSPP